MECRVSLLALVIGTLLNMGLGALWYSPVLFAKVWMKEAHVTPEDLATSQGKMGMMYGLTGVSALLTSYVIGVFILNLKIMNIAGALGFAILLWLGTNIPAIVKNWSFEGRTIKLGIINHGYDLVVYVLVSMVYVIIG
ncbi:DUF1761 domain-containing protein [Clostridia bacterium]|nr:DUF1761 domain-containing protein [Clostridia bacterium]